MAQEARKQLTTTQILLRSELCKKNQLCFITLDPLTENPYELNHPEAGNVFVNSLEHDGVFNLWKEQQDR